MKGYAYLTKEGILHITSDKETAKEYCGQGIVVETEAAYAHGYPLAGGKEIIVYDENTMKLESTDKENLDPLNYPELAALYSQCRG